MSQAPSTGGESPASDYQDCREFVDGIIEGSVKSTKQDYAAVVVQSSMSTYSQRRRAQNDLVLSMQESEAFQRENSDFARQQEEDYSAWVIQKCVRRMLWVRKQERGELGPEHTDYIDMSLARASAVKIQANFRGYRTRKQRREAVSSRHRRGGSHGIQADDGSGEEIDDDDGDDDLAHTQSRRRNQLERSGGASGAYGPEKDGLNSGHDGEGTNNKSKPFSVESMWVEREIDTKDHRSEEKKMQGYLLQQKFFPLGTPKFPAPRFARAFLQESHQLDNREQTLRRTLVQQIDQQRGQFSVISKRLLQMLATEADDRQRVVRREGRYRSLVEEEEQLHWSALVRLDLALRFGDEWADTYATLVEQVVETETKRRKDLAKEELSVRSGLAVREYKNRKQVLNFKSSFSSILGRGDTTASSSALALADQSIAKRRQTSSLQAAEEYSRSNTGFSKEFESSNVHLRSRRAIQRLEHQQTNAIRAEEVRQENQLFESALTDTRHWQLSKNFARAIKQRDESKARRKAWNRSRADHLEKVRYEAKIDEFASRRVAYESKHRGEASPELYNRLLLQNGGDSSSHRRQHHSQNTSAMTPIGKRPNQLRDKVQNERRVHSALDFTPTEYPENSSYHNDHPTTASSPDPSSHHRQRDAPPTRGGVVSRGVTPGTTKRNPATSDTSMTLLPTEAKLVTLVERVQAKYGRVINKSSTTRDTSSQSSEEKAVQSLLNELPAEPTEQCKASIHRALALNKAATRLMQSKNPNDPALAPGSTLDGLLDDPLGTRDPVKAASSLLKIAAQEVKTVLQQLRIQFAHDQQQSSTKKKNTTTTAEDPDVEGRPQTGQSSTNQTTQGKPAGGTATSGGVIQRQISLVSNRLDLITVNNMAVHARATQQLRLAAKYLQNVLKLEESTEGKPSVSTLLNTSAVLVQLDEPTSALEYARSAERRLCETLTILVAGEEEDDDPDTNHRDELNRSMTLAVTALHNVAIAQSVCPKLSENNLSHNQTKFGGVGDTLLSTQASGKNAGQQRRAQVGGTQIATATERNACRRTFQRSQEIADIVLGSGHPLSQAILKSSSRVASALVKGA